MKKRMHLITLYATILSCLFLLSFIKKPKHNGDILIKNVSVIDVRKGKVISNQNVLIKGDKILAISRNSKNMVAESEIDGTDKYLIPGLWDMHTHNWWQLHFSNYYIANGILGLRNMYTPMQMIKPVVDSINKNLIHGPYCVVAGRVLEGTEPEFPDWIVVDKKEKINAALDTLQMEGSDFVKVYNKIPRDVYFDLVKEAHKRGMRVEGHLPMSVSAIEASNAGQKSFEHLLGIPDLCTKEKLFANNHKYNWFASVMSEKDYGIMQFDEATAAKNLQILKKNKTYICPTLVVWNTYFHPDYPFENDLNLNKFPADIREFWAGEVGKYRKKDIVYKEIAANKYENFKRTTYLLYKYGVPLIAGTDVINPYCYPGFSLHKELSLLNECGIPAEEVLKMATINAAEFLGLEKRFGEVKMGLEASLVLLTANPLKDINNTSKIDKVILKGKLIDRPELNTLLK